MNRKEIIILLAEFLGGKKITPETTNYDVWQFSDDIYRSLFDGHTEPSIKNSYSLGAMRFNESWDWLMAVVDKIRKVKSYDKGDIFGTEVIINGSVTTIKSGKYNHTAPNEKLYFNKNFSESNSHQATLKAVVAYVQWFNSIQN